MASVDEAKCSSTSLTVKKIRRQKCLNRRCKHGSDLVNASGMVCRFYHVNDKPGKQVIQLFIYIKSSVAVIIIYVPPLGRRGS